MWLMGNKVSICRCTGTGTLTLNCPKWPRQNFSLPYQYDSKQISDENKEKKQLEEFFLVDLILNSPSLQHKNCIANSKEI